MLGLLEAQRTRPKIYRRSARAGRLPVLRGRHYDGTGSALPLLTEPPNGLNGAAPAATVLTRRLIPSGGGLAGDRPVDHGGNPLQGARLGSTRPADNPFAGSAPFVLYLYWTRLGPVTRPRRHV